VPHRSDVVVREGDRLTVRVLFACPPDHADRVRAAVAGALDAGALHVPDPEGRRPTGWQVLEQAPATITEGELAVAARLVAHPYS
jgi:hypothetical protein